MITASRGVAILVSTALLASTAIAPMAEARDRHQPQHAQRSHGHDNTGALIGLGIFALAGAALIASASQPAEPVYAPAPVYPPQPTYLPQPSYQPIYAQPGYAQPNCTTINGYAACQAPDGTWQYVR